MEEMSMNGLACLALFWLVFAHGAQNTHKVSDEIEEDALSRYLAKQHGCQPDDIHFASLQRADFLNAGYDQAVVVASTCMTGTAGPDVHAVYTRDKTGEIAELAMEEVKLTHRVLFGNANSGYRIDGDTLVEVFVDSSEREDPLVVKYRWSAAKQTFVVVAVLAAQPFRTSYDCDKAGKAADETAQAICYVESLARLDRELAQHYQAYLKLLAPAERTQAIQTQRAWLEERNKRCVIYKFWVDCLDEAYKKRIAELQVRQREKASAGRP
jgi:uncharacterized protein YecT (DUF1311 family)